MSTQRVVIASLFLPESVSIPSPRPADPRPDVFGARPGKALSIVDDLKDKSRNPPPDESNPFATAAVPRPASAPRAPWHIEPNPHANGGLKNAVDSLRPNLRHKLWVGTLGTSTDPLGPAPRRAIEHAMAALPAHPSRPVWVPDAEFHSCYADFCHRVLWPCLHYAIPDAPKTKTFYESASFNQYVAVNQRFADAIIAAHNDGDIIWVNDYHLMLLPGLLRASGKIPPTTPIGFFMHVAFPSSEIFRCLSVRQHLLRGVLGADLVGFQTASYARHFRQTVHRILAYEALPKGIMVADGDGAAGEDKVGEDGQRARGRFVDVGVFPMGIDVGQLKLKKQEPEVKEWIQLLAQRYAGMKIVVGRDKLDEIQGVRHKIKAFEYFLEHHPEFQGKAILIQIALPTQSLHAHTPSHPLLEAPDVTEAIARINARFSTLTYQPVVFLHTQDLTFSQYLALLSAADAFIVTSLREGMALRTHEFVECQEGRWRPLVLSEFAGSYSYSGFRSCIAINPWDTRGTGEAINQALTMSDEEARMRWEDLHNHVTTQTAQAFVSTFLHRTLRANAEDQAPGAAAAVPRLDMGKVGPRYGEARRRVVVVDLEGTLWRRDLSREGLGRMEDDYRGAGAGEGGEGGGQGGKPLVEVPEEVLDVLERLTGDLRNEVWLLSGLRVRGLLERIGRRVPRLGIVAENGCFIKMIGEGPGPRRGGSIAAAAAAGAGAGAGEWVNMVSNFNLSWKTACLEILHYFAERTPGSFIEERDASIVFRFWTGGGGTMQVQGDDDSIGVGVGVVEDPGRTWARRQAAEAQNHIFDSLGEQYGLRIIPGRNSFLVLPNNVSRSTAVGAILHPNGPVRSSAASSSSSSSSSLLTRAWMNTDVFDGSGSSRGVGVGSGASSSGGAIEPTFILAISGDEKLLRRLNEVEGAETCSTSGRGTDARWRVGRETGEVLGVLWGLVGAGEGGSDCS